MACVRGCNRQVILITCSTLFRMKLTRFALFHLFHCYDRLVWLQLHAQGLWTSFSICSLGPHALLCEDAIGPRSQLVKALLTDLRPLTCWDVPIVTVRAEADQNQAHSKTVSVKYFHIFWLLVSQQCHLKYNGFYIPLQIATTLHIFLASNICISKQNKPKADTNFLKDHQQR